MEKAKAMMNMAMSISTINNVGIERMDLQKHNLRDVEYYSLTVWYSDGKEITIRQDCTIVDRTAA